MARCVISVILDTDVGGLVAACMVHTTYTPCPHDGEPACATPLHAMLGHTSRQDAIRMWEVRTRRQRPLIIHYDDGCGADGHNLGTDAAACPCGAEVLPAEEG